MKKKSYPVLLTPGPVPASPPILEALAEPMIHHRTQAFVEDLKQAQQLLQKFFQTKQPVLILNATGTGAMSAALLNTLSPGDQVLSVSAGKFGERWTEMAESYQLNVINTPTSWGKAINIRDVKKELQKNTNIKAVLSQACETSTGVLHPIKELAEMCQQHKVLFILDAISALGAVDIPMDKWGIDVLIGGSQKSFGLPAGMSFIALSEKAWHFNKESKLPVYYLDLRKELKAQAKGQTAFSSNVAFVRALAKALEPIEKQGLQFFIQRSKNLSKITLDFCKKLNLKIYAETPSPSVTSIALPTHIDGVKLKKQIENKYNVVVGGGQGKLQGKIIRIGHLGNISIEDLKQGLTALTYSLHEMDSQIITDKQLQTALNYLKTLPTD